MADHIYSHPLSASQDPPRKRRRLDQPTDPISQPYCYAGPSLTHKYAACHKLSIPVDFDQDHTAYGSKGTQENSARTQHESACADTEKTPHLDGLVCFGMIANVPVRLHRDHDHTSSRPPTFCCVDRHGSIFGGDEQTRLGTTDKHTAEAINVLSSEPGLWTQIAITSGDAISKQKNGARPALNAIIYGPYSLFEDVGKFTQDCDIYLQDPMEGVYNVPYMNPHRLSRAERPHMTLDLSRPHRNDVAVPKDVSDFFANFESGEILDTADTPAALRTPLHPHQRQALGFMKRRERGWSLFGPHQDIWLAKKSGPNQSFLNCVTGDEQLAAPPEFRGGLLADEMGLGKTLSMIALVASDKDSEVREIRDPKEVPENFTSCTLIVVPSPLLQVWECQLEQHLLPQSIAWIKHHDNCRITDLPRLRQYDIVLTTYQTIAAERSSAKHRTSLISTAHWKRIILDEAHYVRNRRTTTAKAICSLKSDCRWAMTGTPVQNSLNDFASLLEFLRVHPFEEPSAFDKMIQKPWKEGNVKEATERIKQLVQCVVLRRLKTTVQLPDRYDIFQYVDFTTEEHACYRQVSCPVEEMLDHLAHQQVMERGQFLSVIQRINILRMICNLGDTDISPSFQLTEPAGPSAEHSLRKTTAQSTFESLISIGQAVCFRCCTELHCMDAVETSDDFLRSYQSPQMPRLYRCLKVVCAFCFQQCNTPRSPGYEQSDCGCSSSCPSEPVRLAPTPLPLASPEPPTKISSKVQALVNDIQTHLNEKSVVFSFWTRSLDMVQRALQILDIDTVRFDGRVSARDRKKALERFRNNPQVRVMLITTSCGAVGLDLTAASRAYLLEPQWNPTTEEQALARIHRMGQRRPVTTIRLIVKNSFEEHIMNVQDRKRQLADLLFSKAQSDEPSTSRAKYKQLRSLVSGNEESISA